MRRARATGLAWLHWFLCHKELFLGEGEFLPCGTALYYAGLKREPVHTGRRRGRLAGQSGFKSDLPGCEVLLDGHVLILSRYVAEALRIVLRSTTEQPPRTRRRGDRRLRVRVGVQPAVIEKVWTLRRSADYGQIDRGNPTFCAHCHGDRRLRIPAVVDVTIEDEEPLVGKGQVLAGELGELDALRLQGPDQAHAEDLVVAEFAAPTWYGLDQSALKPVLDLARSEPCRFAKLCSVHRNRSYNASAEVDADRGCLGNREVAQGAQLP